MKKSRVGEFNPTHFRTFTTFTTDVDLTAQSGCPPYEAERLEVTNETAGALDITVRGPDAVDVEIDVPANTVRVVRAPVYAIDADTDDTLTSVTAYWWWDGSVTLNP